LNIVRLLVAFSMVIISALALAQQPVKVELRKSGSCWKLLQEGKAYYI
jgi:hypothetical protein